MTEQDKTEEKLSKIHGSKTTGSAAGKSEMKNEASRQEAPAGVQSVETEDPSLKGASREEQHELLKQNVQPAKGRKPQAEPAEADPPAGLHATGTKLKKKAR